MKKLLLLILLISFIFFFPSYTPSLPTDPMPSSTSLDLWVQDPTKQVELYFNQAISRFNKVYPHITINLKMLKGDDLKVSHYLATARLNQDTPDLVASSLAVFNQLVTEHFLLPIDNLVASYPDNYFLETALKGGYYNSQLYGIAYALNPEILFYRKDFLADLEMPAPENLNTLEKLNTYAEAINKIYQSDRLHKIAFAIPTLTSDGSFIASLLHTTPDLNTPDTTFKLLDRMYNTFDISPYHYNKIETHPFLTGQAALGLEPLSLIYSAIEKDNNLLKKIGIMPLPETGLQFAYSEHHYLSICKNSAFEDEARLLLQFFFSTAEVLERYRALNLPVVLESLIPTFINDNRFQNELIADYIKASFHFPLSPTLQEELHLLDTTYEKMLHQDYFK